MTTHDPVEAADTVLAVGTDVAKDELVTAVWDPQQQRGQLLAPCANEDAGFASLAQQVEAQAQAYGATRIHLTLEPSGGYELAWAYFALQRGWQVSMVNPKTVRDWAKGLGRRAKTDQLDAVVLAQYTVERHPPAWQPPTPELQELMSLLARRSDLVQMRQAERNRQKQLQARVGTAAPVVHTLQTMLTTLEQAIDQIDHALNNWRQQHPPLDEQAQRLDTLPGVGEKTVPRLLAVLLRWQLLTGGRGSDKALTAFVGLDPLLYTSGASVRKHALISKQGDPDLRAALYMAVLGALRGHNALHDFYNRLVARGKKKKVALVACMHKLIIWAWHIFVTHQPYDATKHPIPS